MLTHETHMRQALTLAQASESFASPNPTVGCVLVRENKVFAQGAHLYNLRDHAEIVALKQAEARSISVRGATAYVTLEPCSHHGRTGPCADALIQAGVSHCVIATADANPVVSGHGIARLRAAGIQVTVGVLEAEARTLNDAFAWSIQHGTPMVTLKSALSVDGMLAPATRTQTAPVWLTGPESRAHVQRLRHASDAILTGIGTVLADNPSLTDRTALPRRRPLLRVVLDPTLRLPLDSTLAQSATPEDLLLIHGPQVTRPCILELHQAGIRRHLLDLDPTHGGLDLRKLLQHLARLDIRSVLLEAGPTLNSAFLTQNLVQKAVLFFSETELGKDAVPFARGAQDPFRLQQSLTSTTHRTFAAIAGRSDACVTGYLQDPWQNIPKGQLS